MRKIFIAGTDTNIGKTYIATGLLKKFNLQNYQTIGLKPVASGSIKVNNKIYNEDALILQKTASIFLDYEQVNPYAFEQAIAPHIAASINNLEIWVKDLSYKITPIFNFNADFLVIEGAGGWYMPLNYQETMADLVKNLNLEVILVIGIKLGCLNHAILTFKAMESEGINIIGWVANCINPYMEYINDNIFTLRKILNKPCLGIVKFNEDPVQVLKFDL